MQRTFLFLLIASLSFGCGMVPTKEYEGPDLPTDQLATIIATLEKYKLHKDHGIRGFSVTRIDSRKHENPITKGCGGYVGCRILPGDHSIDLVYFYPKPVEHDVKYHAKEFFFTIAQCLGLWTCLLTEPPHENTKCKGTMTFNAVAGHTYNFDMAYSSDDLPITINLIDTAANEQIVSAPCETVIEPEH